MVEDTAEAPVEDDAEEPVAAEANDADDALENDLDDMLAEDGEDDEEFKDATEATSNAVQEENADASNQEINLDDGSGRRGLVIRILYLPQQRGKCAPRLQVNRSKSTFLHAL